MFNVTFIQPPFDIITPLARVTHTTGGIEYANLVKALFTTIRKLMPHNAYLETVTERNQRLNPSTLYLFKLQFFECHNLNCQM